LWFKTNFNRHNFIKVILTGAERLDIYNKRALSTDSASSDKQINTEGFTTSTYRYSFFVKKVEAWDLASLKILPVGLTITTLKY